MNNSAVLVDKCLRILEAEVGIVDAERFLFAIKTEDFDYTKWQHERYDSMTLEELNAAAVEHAKKHPWPFEKARLLKPKTRKAKTPKKK